ncbi:hypothetical protein D3C81_861390 [compost metagenome]
MAPLQRLLTDSLPGALLVMLEGGLISIEVIRVADRPGTFGIFEHFKDLAVDADVGFAIKAVHPHAIRGDVCQLNIAGIGRQVRLPQALLAAGQGDTHQAVHTLACLQWCGKVACGTQADSQDDIQSHRLKMCQCLIQLAGLPGMSPVDNFLDQLPGGDRRHDYIEHRHEERSGIERVETNVFPVSQALLLRRLIDLRTGHGKVAGIGFDSFQQLVLHIAKQLIFNRHITQVQIGLGFELATGIKAAVIQRLIKPLEEMFLLMPGHKSTKQLQVSGRQQVYSQVLLERCH